MQHLEQEARVLCDRGDFEKALLLCNHVLSKSPHVPSMLSLRRTVMERRRRAVLELNQQIQVQLISDRNPERILNVVQDALARFPNEPVFRQRFDEYRQILEEVRIRAIQAHSVADEGQFEEACALLDGIEKLHPEFPALTAERERISVMQEKAKLARRKSRITASIRLSLDKKDFERTRSILQLAFVEFPNDDELHDLERQSILLEKNSNEALSLFYEGSKQVLDGEFESGIETLREASMLDPDSRRIQMAHCDALIQFAKNIVDDEPKRAKHLVLEAGRICPFSLALENAAQYLSDRIRDRALEECNSQILVLRQNCELREALKLVDDLADRLHLHDDPEVMELRQGLRKDLGLLESTVISLEPEPVPDTVEEVHSRFDLLLASKKFIQTFVSDWSESKLVRRVNRARRHAIAAFPVARLKTQYWRNRAQESISHLPMKLKVGGAASLLLIFASILLGLSMTPKPDNANIGSGTLLTSVTLFEKPTDFSRPAGNLKSGQAVVILSQLPKKNLDAWTLVRAVSDKGPKGYVRVRNLDQIKTGNPLFDLWYAMTLLDRATNPGDFRYRVALVDETLKMEPPAPSPDSDQIFFTVAKAFLRIARESLAEPQTATAALDSADAYFSRITGDLLRKREASIVKASIQSARADIGDIATGSELWKIKDPDEIIKQ